MKNFHFFLIISNLLLNLFSSENLIEIPFEIFDSFNSKTLMFDLYYSQIKTRIKLGSKSENFNATISFHCENFYIFGEEMKEKNPEFFPFFNRNSSDSFKTISSLMPNFFEVYSKSFQAKDKIEFENFIINEFKFIYALEFNDDFAEKKIPNCVLGLQKFSDGGLQDFSIANQLKMNKKIEKKTFHFEFQEKNIFNEKGKIFFGFDFFPNENVLKINSGKDQKNRIKWSFNFDHVKIGERKLNYSNDAIIFPEIGLLKSTSEFFEFVQKDFFDKEKCELLPLNNSTDPYRKKFYYSCDKNVDVNKMKPLKFYLKKINFHFVFEPEDLFREIEGKKIFLVVLTKAASSYWVFGREFLKKYQLFFDEDRKIIGIQSNNKNNDNNNKNNDNNNNNNNNDNYNNINDINDINNNNNNNNEKISVKNENFLNVFFIVILSVVIIIIIIILIIITKKTKNKKNFIPKLKNENDFSLELKNEYSTTEESLNYKKITN